MQEATAVFERTALLLQQDIHGPQDAVRRSPVSRCARPGTARLVETTRRAKHPKPVNPSSQNILLSRISDLWHRALIPALPEGRFAIVTRCGSGCGGRGSAGAIGGDRDGRPLSHARRGTTRRGHSGLVDGQGRAHRAPDTEVGSSADGEVVWSRRPGFWRQVLR